MKLLSTYGENFGFDHRQLFGYAFTTMFSLCDTIAEIIKQKTPMHLRAVNFIFDDLRQHSLVCVCIHAHISATYLID